ncbi:MAG: hypothetical protein HUK40_14900 [Desulfobacter sp.]|nr:hypothetical protein [Desulfobacter sp.]
MIIPWQAKDEFFQVGRFFSLVDERRGKDLDPVRDLAEKIANEFDAMGPDLDLICAQTCPECRDNCCERATIWYDFKDMLYLYFGLGRLPDSQVFRKKNALAVSCIHLGNQGCLLARKERPFVCTWYFCPNQKQTSLYPDQALRVEKIKALRTQAATVFCTITAG